MRLSRLAPALLALPFVLHADTVEMKDTGLKLEGKVHRETEEYIIFLPKDGSGETESGRIRILRSKIKNIEYDVKTQLSALKEGDNAGKYKVALWAMEKGMHKEAVDLFEDIKGKEGVPTEIYKHLGNSYEQREQLDRALQSFLDYSKVNPDDKAVAEKVKELTEKVQPKKTAGNVTASGGKKVVDGLEADGNWVTETWQDCNPGVIQAIVEPGTGNKTIAVQSGGGAKDKVAASRTGQLLNLSESTEMQYRLFNKAATPLQISIAFINAQGDFFESKLMRLAPNQWVDQKVNVAGKNFKSNLNKFTTYDQEMVGRERISRIIFMVYGQREFTMYIDSVFFK